MTRLKTICVFCGSSFGKRPQYARAAKNLGAVLAKNKITLIYGGGRVGLMGVIADSVLSSGGKVVGVIPKALATKELAHTALTRQHVVNTMHERKALMAQLSDAFIALPGGFGTLEEFCEVLTWSQLGMHKKPCALLNVARYFDPLLTLFDHAASEAFVSQANRNLVLQARTPERLISALRKWTPPKNHVVLRDAGLQR
ncbi:MAG TPA: TIGR00730 family Rossman fold protein [Planctomycetota bacterium]|jgi:hypothetical protein